MVLPKWGKFLWGVPEISRSKECLRRTDEPLNIIPPTAAVTSMEAQKKDTRTKKFRSAKLLRNSFMLLGALNNSIQPGHCSSRGRGTTDGGSLSGRLTLLPSQESETKQWRSPGCFLARRRTTLLWSPDLLWTQPKYLLAVYVGIFTTVSKSNISCNLWILDKHRTTYYDVGAPHERLIRGVLPRCIDSLTSRGSH